MNNNFIPEELDNIIVLNDEEGNEASFEFLDLIEYKGDEYVVLLPTEGEDTDMVVILRLEEADEETEAYVSVDNAEDLDAIFKIFKDKFKDIFNFTD